MYSTCVSSKLCEFIFFKSRRLVWANRERFLALVNWYELGIICLGHPWKCQKYKANFHPDSEEEKWDCNNCTYMGKFLQNGRNIISHFFKVKDWCWQTGRGNWLWSIDMSLAFIDAHHWNANILWVVSIWNMFSKVEMPWMV